MAKFWVVDDELDPVYSISDEPQPWADEIELTDEQYAFIVSANSFWNRAQDILAAKQDEAQAKRKVAKNDPSSN